MSNSSDAVDLVKRINDLLAAVSGCGCGSSHSAVDEVPKDDQLVQEHIVDAIDKAEQEVLMVLPGAGTSRDRLSASLWALQHAQRRDLRVRALFPLTHRRMVQQHHGSEARVANVSIEDLLIVDGSFAVHRPPESGSAGALVLRAPGVVRLLRRLFTDAWQTATPADKAGPIFERMTSPLIQQVLASLWAGDIDEVGARKLGVSVRTYRRHVAELLRDLNATSRFQAGVRIAELRLLNPE